MSNKWSIQSTALSPIASMLLVEVVVAICVIVVSYHFFRLAFETHTFLASGAGDSVAAVNTNDRNFTFLVGTLSDTILFHVFFECLVTSTFGLLT